MNKKKTEDLIVLILTSESDSLLAENLAEEILKKQLAICISIQSVKSQYWWKGKLEKDQEVQLLIKTSKSKIDNLKKAFKELHSYETPEWVQWDATTSQGYGKWAQSIIDF